VALNKEFTDKAICTASRQYQNLKIKELAEQNLTAPEYKTRFDKIIEKSCICVGLGTSSLLVNGLETKTEGTGVSICPGPNLAYFSKVMSLKEIVDHIYGRANVIARTDRPNVFVKELNIYIDYLKNKIEETKVSMNDKQQLYLLSFASNLQKGKDYYEQLFNNVKGVFEETKSTVLKELENSEKALQLLYLEIQKKSLVSIDSK